MILTIMKQYTRFFMDEKEYEAANVYAELYSNMVLQYIPKRSQAICALKDLAYDYYSIGHYRNAKKYFQKILENFGPNSLKDEDLICLGECEERLNLLGDAIHSYQILTRYYPQSPLISKAIERLSEIFLSCSNRIKSRAYLKLLNHVPDHPLPSLEISESQTKIS